MRSRRIAAALLLLPCLALVAWLFWYRGAGETLSAGDAEQLLQQIEAQTQQPGGRHDLAALRSFLASDDGKPFYTVNLYRFHERAQYLPGQPFEGTGVEAYERFSRVMLRLLAQHASHPVFGSRWSDAGAGTWDRVVVVRYRSRRDLAEIFASDAFAEASAHKWAAIAGHQRMLVGALHLPELPLPALLLGLVFVQTTFFVAFTHRRETR